MTEKLLKKLLHPSLVFVLGQSAVGALNYLYQLYLTQVISPLEFGRWSVWFAQFSVTLLFALWVQTLCTLDGPEQKKFSFLSKTKVKWGLILGISAVSFGSLAVGELSVFSGVGWAWALLQAVYFGRALASEELRLVSVAMFAGTLFKFSFPLIFGSEISCYLGVLFGPLVTVYIMAFFEERHFKVKGKASSKTWSLLTLGSALMLAMGTTWVPQMDLLMANILLNSEAMAQFAKVALVYKAFFFFFLILAQLLLSKQVQGPEAQFSPRKLLAVPAVGVVIAVLCFVTFPESVAPSRWVGLSILHISTLTYLFLLLQSFASQSQWRAGFLILGLLAFEALGVRGSGAETMELWGAFLGLTALELYFAMVILFEALLGAAFLARSLK